MTFWDFADKHECLTLVIVLLMFVGVDTVSSNIARACGAKPPEPAKPEDTEDE